ncbi:DEAD-box ATP-dependent RNA helicase 40-like [Tasmannia lanceolata]|uniref:DEAD-box ATP-dependent RNA helicase 40-like n=1 Tax=Tasmannia lanceolata TaxID=3420 RepID=UPI0040628A7A
MATTESTTASLGPRYAPEDPTLPSPWKGLIDGSTGLPYYWNPESNVTQYERPATLPPPLPPGPPPTVSTPKLAPIPLARTLQPNGILAQQGPQVSQQQGQPIPQQQGQQVPHNQGQQVPNHLGQQVPQQQGHQMWQQQGQPIPQQQGHQIPLQQAQQMPQHQGQQMPQQQGHQMPQQQGQQVPHQLGQKFLHPQLQQLPYQPIPHPQGPQIQYPSGQQITLHQGKQTGFSPKEEIGFQQGNQIGISSPQVQQTGYSSIHNLTSGTHPVQIPQMIVHSAHTQQTGISSVSLQPIAGSMVQNQVGLAMGRNQQAAEPPMGLKMRYDENHRGRTGNDLYFNSSKEGAMMTPQQPKLASIPLAHNQQEMRIPASHPQTIPSGLPSGLNIAPGNAMSNMYNHPAGSQTFSNNAPVRLPPRIVGSSDLSNLSATDAYCRQHEVNATGDNVPAPFMTFEATGFPLEILTEMHLAGFSSPTPIQAQTWPIALQSRDIVAIAKTGSGKTLGYLIPAFIHLRRGRNNTQNGPTVLVLAPTRELATQIQDEVVKFGQSSRVSCACLYGGAPKGPQLREIERGVDIVVATPGRLNDILEMKKINFRQVSFLVLDEADRMLDMGFEPQIRKIVNEIPPRRQTLMYTATWPKEVRKIAGDLLVNPVQVNIGSVDELAANKSITQHVEVVAPMEKQRRLEQILRSQERGSKVIIFCSTKRLCDQLARSIGRNFGAAAIHGDKNQGERDWVLNQFRSGKSPILVATDVAARGLDIKDIRVVINYDFPTGIEDYVHRIGRTGRAGATGIAITFFSDQDWKHAADLLKVLEGANQQVPPQLREIATRGGPTFNKGRGGISRWDSGGGRFDSGGGGISRFDSGGGRFDSGGRGYGGRGRGRNDLDSGGRGYGGRGGGRNDLSGGRGNRGRGFGGPSGFGRNGRGPHDRYNGMDGPGRNENRRGFGERSRGRSYSPSPDRVRTWDYDRSRSGSRSRSRSRSRSWSRSRSQSRSRSRSFHRRGPPATGFDIPAVAGYGVPPASRMSPMSPAPQAAGPGEEPIQLPVAGL